MGTRGGTVEKDGSYEAFVVRFDGFERLPAVKGQSRVASSKFTCFGHQWSLGIWPGGVELSPDGDLAIFLHNETNGSIEVEAYLAVERSTAAPPTFEKLRPHKYPAQNSGGGRSSWGVPNFARRSAIIRGLHDGALVIKVLMKQTGPSTLPTPFVPANPLHTTILKKFMDEKSADVVFVVSSDLMEGGRKKRKRAKTSPSTFHAHRFIVEDSAPALAEACKLTEGLNPVPIAGVRPEIFKVVLYYAYGGEVDDEEMKESTKEILEAADRFGVTNLKLAAEACYVEATDISIDNVLENLVYADAKNCALLKEHAMDFIVENGVEVVKRVSLKDFPHGLYGDLLTAMNMGKTNEKGNSGEELCMMRVSELRRKLNEKGLNVDGSREAMIAALEGSP